VIVEGLLQCFKAATNLVAKSLIATTQAPHHDQRAEVAESQQHHRDHQANNDHEVGETSWYQ
jgi:hypothetical protein